MIIRVNYPSFLCLLDHWHEEFKVVLVAATAARSVEPSLKPLGEAFFPWVLGTLIQQSLRLWESKTQILEMSTGCDSRRVWYISVPSFLSLCILTKVPVTLSVTSLMNITASGTIAFQPLRMMPLSWLLN